MKHQDLINFILAYLAIEGPSTTQAILYAYNQKSRHGSTMNCISNILARRPTFVKVGFFSAPHDSSLAGRVRGVIWELAV